MLGSGSLAREICRALAPYPPLRVVLIARNRAAATEIAPGRVRHVPVFTEAALRAALADVRPRAVLLCASTQSPWERYRAPSAWTDLVAAAGFGLTMPFQADLAAVTGRAVAAACPGAWFFNACFPDAVNPVLTDLGIPVHAGIGNIGLVAASIATASGVSGADLHVLAHHLHLSRPANPEVEALAWLRGKPAPPAEVTGYLAAQRATYRPRLNERTGRATAAMLARLLHGVPRGEVVATHLPGPGGEPGGYPVTVSADGIALRLPEGLPLEEARRRHRGWALRDGVLTGGGRVTWGGRVLAELGGELDRDAGVDRLAELREQLSAVRDRLRALDARVAAVR